MNGTTRRAGLLLAGGAALISGVAVFVNGYGVKAVGNATVYTTAQFEPFMNAVLAGGSYPAGSHDFAAFQSACLNGSPGRGCRMPHAGR